MASLKRSKLLSKADFDKTIIKQSNQLKKEQEARLISQDEEMKFMINSLIRTSKMKQNKMKNHIRPTLLKMVAEIDKKTSTINTYLQKTAEVGVAANSKDIDSTIFDQKTHSKPVIVKYKKINLDSEQMYTDTLNVFKNPPSQEYRLSPKMKYSPISKSPNRQIQRQAGIKLKSKTHQSPLGRPHLETNQSSIHTQEHEQINIQNCRQPIAKRKQQTYTSSQPQVMSIRKQKFVQSSAQQLSPNSKQLQKHNYIQQPIQNSTREESLSPKRKQVTGIKVKTEPSTKRSPKQINVRTIVKK